MNLSSDLITLGNYLAGEFDNQEQALAEPAWYVNLRLWQVPVDLFPEDSLSLFAEQVNTITPNNPYRQRVMRLQIDRSTSEQLLQVQYYLPKNPTKLAGAGRDRELLKELKLHDLELLPGCILNVETHILAGNNYRFIAKPPRDTKCCFMFQDKTIQVSLGFEVTNSQLFSYDKGVDPQTGQATWGAILGPFSYTKRKQYEFFA